MTVNFTANVSGLKSGVSSAQGTINSFAGAAGAALLATGAVIVGAGIAATKMAGDFQAGITSLSTGAGEAQSNLKMVGDGILGLATSTGTSTKQLTDGMYMIESAGYHGAAGLDVLKAAAEGAKVGNADLGTVANGVTTIMTDFASQNVNATQATNTLVATVASGKTTMQELSASLSGVLPTASAAGVGLTDVMSAMATMTGEGVPAANAATYLRQTIMNLSAPSKGTSDALKSIGLSAQQVSDGIKTSLPNTLDMITTALGKKFPAGSLQYNEALSKIAGGSKQLQGILDLTGQHMYTLQNNFGQIDNSVTGTGNKINGFSQVQQNFNFKLAQAQEVIETTGIKIGTALLPAVGRLLSAFTSPGFQSFATAVGNLLVTAVNGLANALNVLIPIVSNVVSFFQHNQAAMVALQGVLMIVAGVIGGLLVQAFVAWTIATWAQVVATWALAGPFIIAGIIIALVIFGIILAIQHWGAITAWFQGVWGAVSSWFMGIIHAVGAFFVSVWQGIASFFTGLWQGIITGLQAAWNFIVNIVKIGIEIVLVVLFAPIIAIAALFIWLYQHNTYFQMLVDAIVNFFKGCFAWVQSAWTATINWLVGLWNGLVGFASALWAKVSEVIRAGFFAAIAFVQGIWQQISSFFINAWNTYIAGPLHTLWTNVSSVFSSAWSTYIAGPISSLWNMLSSTVSGWATSAFDWGKNLIQGFINGIKNMAGAVGQTLGDVAHNIASFLGFHSPTEKGPGSTADQWAPNFVNMYTQGLEAGIPKIQAAMSKLAAPMELSLKSGSSSYPNGNSNSTSAILAALAAGNNNNSNNNNNQPIAFYVDGKEVTSALGPHMANAIRMQGRRAR